MKLVNVMLGLITLACLIVVGLGFAVVGTAPAEATVVEISVDLLEMICISSLFFIILCWLAICFFYHQSNARDDYEFIIQELKQDSDFPRLVDARIRAENEERRDAINQNGELQLEGGTDDSSKELCATTADWKRLKELAQKYFPQPTPKHRGISE